MFSYQTKEKERAGKTVQPKLKIGQSGDKYEQEADAVADRVMRMSQCETIRMQPIEEEEEMMQTKLRMQPLEEEEELLQMKSGDKGNFKSFEIEQQVNSTKGNGKPLSGSIKEVMRPFFQSEFSQVRLHTDPKSQDMNQRLHSKAFTHGSDIYFNKGQYNPQSNSGKQLLAHELTHVVQQKEGLQSKNIQREVQLRPPGRGEASAFDRVDEFIQRLNAVASAGATYRLDGQVLRMDISDEAALSHFDRQMRGYIERAEIVPMRLITGEGYVGGGPLLVDSLQLGYVDLDDMLASDDLGFQSNIMHVLGERFAVRDYNRRLGTAGVGAEWNRAHPVGLRAEAEFFQNIFNDPSIRFSWDRTSPNGNYIAVFRSRDQNYRVMLQITGGRNEVRGTHITVRTADGRTLSVQDFQAERAAAVAP